MFFIRSDHPKHDARRLMGPVDAGLSDWSNCSISLSNCRVRWTWRNDILVFLIRNRDRVVSKDDLLTAVWNGRIVSESAIAARINAVRRAVGDDGEQQRWIRTVVRRGFRFVGDVREDAILETPSSSLETATRRVPCHPSRGQEITFCRTKDGINLAVACVGQGVPLVSIPTWLTP
jgi:DNA-binding winged helix-turn-helix (wHTH) protein